MIDWEQRRKDWAAGKFRRKIIERKPKNLVWDWIMLECGHVSETSPQLDPLIVRDGYTDCYECAKAEGPE